MKLNKMKKKKTKSPHDMRKEQKTNRAHSSEKRGGFPKHSKRDGDIVLFPALHHRVRAELRRDGAPVPRDRHKQETSLQNWQTEKNQR